ncbi:Stk1 family PASTA domain-containing Ser/Thr kinase [Cellulomonas sp. zg-ZUI222]|uniref:non-specific serine/threonine protein kinase n=1 Tax=Cellulomonas wangleii TaxID=2816956 RepID=A0ABX8D9I0_9CELL|nr:MULTISPECIES: Stk1 family PASTA domain-containing Ser/Thr kinase [Cellulomonas]MBO0898582.1 Stk1 family PASTA domain-containing Ser/Thr kinase [Cellulomonas sp. zg-ZUI22]MBO0919444.1 Stk1 family PASTA domain-containing Ser/Thr kinase [Cellulomonas wangleii]MBO0924416.1 Stk1 family PASTA domain-containing Ser/Thr kinase [Cellulomonas wangleii]QVI62412.1 Stk1 family PASTA domain-containing Ser/Thr kinase [Cellulomonas wangleii]
MVDEGSRILAGRYEVGELIGRGGMAEVHIGHDTRLGRTVAIKILRSDLARDPSFQNRFRREAQSAAALNHPAIVAVYDTGEDVFTEPTGTVAHVPFIVMEYVEGHTVRDILRDGQAVPIDEAVEITAGVLSALEYSHHAGIVHRDIKPANVMITPTGAVKVMDFGIARAVADSAATMTQTQAVIGTAQYLSPEQARGEQVDARSDLYSTGCLLFELLTGRPPFVGDSPVAVAYQHVREIPPVPSSIASDVPEALDRITLKALAKERDARYSSAAEFRADLEAVLRGGHVNAPAVGAAAAGVAAADATQVMAPTTQTTQAMPPATAPWGATGLSTLETDEPGPDEDEKKRPWLIWVLAAVALLAVGGIVWALMRGQDAPVDTTVAVPTVAGMSQEEAVQTIRDADLVPEPAQEPSDDVPAGSATRTDPAAGETVEKETSVKVYISTGPSEVTVPDVAGQTEAEAAAALEAAGLSVSPTRQPEDNPSVPKGRVTKTDPPAASPVKAGATVTLYVSSGNVVVPNVTGKNVEVATEELTALGLRVNTSNVASTEPEGNVVSQDRPEGAVVLQGSAVNLGIAEPPNTAAVPTNLRGLTYDQAVQALQAVGLTNIAREDVASDEAANTVVSSDPSGGTEIAKEQRVTLRVSRGPSAGNNPAPSPSPTRASDD